MTSRMQNDMSLSLFSNACAELNRLGVEFDAQWVMVDCHYPTVRDDGITEQVFTVKYGRKACVPAN